MSGGKTEWQAMQRTGGWEASIALHAAARVVDERFARALALHAQPHGSKGGYRKMSAVIHHWY